jgi:hypothetical protein
MSTFDMGAGAIEFGVFRRHMLTDVCKMCKFVYACFLLNCKITYGSLANVFLSFKFDDND